MEREWSEHPTPGRLVAIFLTKMSTVKNRDYIICRWDEENGWVDSNKNQYKDEDIWKWWYAGNLFSEISERRREAVEKSSPRRKVRYKLAKGKRING